MSKKLSLLLLVLMRLSAFGQDITAMVKTAASAAPGSDLTVEISVNKAGVSGFMKYFQDLPTGYTAADIDSKGGNFTNADNGAKIIWISPPSSDVFVMSYKVTVPSGATGSISVGGKFSYVVGNERKSFDVAPQSVTIGNSGSNTPKETVKETPPAAENKPASAETKTPPPAEEKPAVVETPAPTPAETKTPPPAEEKPKPAETKKETPVVTAAPVDKAPTSAAATSIPGRSYRVQIGAFSQKPHINGVPEPSTLVLDNGMTKFFSGNFKTYEEAKKRREQMVAKGFEGAFIVGFENGKIVK